MTQVIVSPEADADFLTIVDRLTDLAGHSVASCYASDLRSIYQRLSAFPEIGSPRPRLGSRIRIVVLLPYAMVYDYSAREDMVRIIPIIDGRRNISRRLVRE